MTISPSDNISIGNNILELHSLCELCQNNFPCEGCSTFTQKKIFYNFDRITEIIYSPPPRSADAIYLKNGKIYFIEIKDKKVDDLLYNNKIMVEKLLDSIYTIQKNPLYFRDLNVNSFIVLFSHVKNSIKYNEKLYLRILFQSYGIAINSDKITIPLRSINLYSTHVKIHHRERLTEPNEIRLSFNLNFCNTINENILK